MNSTRAAVSVIALLMGMTAAHADATVSPTDGGVLLFKGKGFVRTTAPTALKVGDRAMVAQGNRAKVSYSDGCAVDLLPGAVHIVGPVSPCARAQGGPNDGRQSDVAGYAVGAGALAIIGASAAISLSESNNAGSVFNSPSSP